MGTLGHLMFQNANSLVQEELKSKAVALETCTDSDFLFFNSPIYQGIDDAIRDVVEDIPTKRPRLSVMFETSGGLVEQIRRMVDTFRRFYAEVEFIIPNFAMSAGTILAMSGDRIWMDYYSILGPIDPQIRRSTNNRFVPALGYLEQYNRYVEQSATTGLTDIEVQFFLNHFDPAELYQYEQERELSISLLREWLVTYKFKDWNVTCNRGLPVTEDMKKTRAEEIARCLNDTGRWHVHGRGITMQILQSEEIRLKIDDFGADPPRNAAIRSYYALVNDFIAKMGYNSAIHTRDGFEWTM